ncbi:MAG: helix-turn-helix domain-containing protein [Prevotellaceae bacterium]|jgi:hypothetical protein|nr:helix-turn-helix domain-containing protein [Prevotellaceae bacterium]
MTSLFDILRDNPTLNITVSAEQLIEVVDYCIIETREKFQKPPATFQSPESAAKILDVDLSTLWRWKKSGYLVPIKIGGKTRYRTSDIEKLTETR